MGELSWEVAVDRPLRVQLAKSGALGLLEIGGAGHLGRERCQGSCFQALLMCVCLGEEAPALRRGSSWSLLCAVPQLCC